MGCAACDEEPRSGAARIGGGVDRMIDIREYPEAHHHADLDELMACCVVDGAVDLRLLDAHRGLDGRPY